MGTACFSGVDLISGQGISNMGVPPPPNNELEREETDGKEVKLGHNRYKWKKKKT